MWGGRTFAENLLNPIIELLEELFSHASRWRLQAFEGVLQAEERNFAVRAVERLNITSRGVRLVYRELNPADQAALKKATKLAMRFAHNYVAHHDEHTEYRLKARSLSDVLESHAAEIFDAAQEAAISEMKSSTYDRSFGRPLSLDDQYLKQMVLAVINDVLETMKRSSR